MRCCFRHIDELWKKRIDKFMSTRQPCNGTNNTECMRRLGSWSRKKQIWTPFMTLFRLTEEKPWTPRRQCPCGDCGGVTKLFSMPSIGGVDLSVVATRVHVPLAACSDTLRTQYVGMISTCHQPLKPINQRFRVNPPWWPVSTPAPFRLGSLL